MATTINKTDGTVLTTVADGAVDTSTTELAFIGRLYRNYGELVNENFAKLLENFANTGAPSAPIIGQIWYDTSDEKLKVYRDTGFVTLAIYSVASAEPNSPAVADLWYDTVDEQFKTWSGSVWTVLGPQYSASQGKSGVFVENILDSIESNHIALLSYQQGSVLSILSRDAEYTPKTAITGFTTIKPGFNLSTVPSTMKLHATATDSELLGGLPNTSFLRKDQADSTVGKISITTDDGLAIGESGDLELQVSASTARIVKTNSGPIQFYVDNSELALEINDDQQVVLRQGTANAPGLTFDGDPNTGFIRSSENVIGFVTDGAVRVTVSNGGLTVANTMNASTVAALSVSSNEGLIQNLSVPTDFTAPTITGNTAFTDTVTFTDEIVANGNVTIGSDLADLFTVNSNSMSIPNGLTINNGDIDLVGSIDIYTNALVRGSASIINDLLVSDDAFITDELLVDYSPDSGLSAFRVTTDRNVLINTVGPKVASANSGDVTLGDFNTVYAINTAKYWVVWQDDDDTSGNLNSSGVGVVGTTTQNNGTSVSLPSGLQKDDVVFSFSCSDDGPVGRPTGYENLLNGTQNSITYQVSYRIMGSTPNTTATGLSRDCRYVFVAVRGVGDLNGNIVDSISPVALANSGMPNPPQHITRRDDTLLFAVGFLDDDAATEVLPPDGFTLAGATGRSVDSNGSIVGSSTMVAYRRFANSGTVVNPGRFTASTQNSDDNIGLTFTIKLNPPAGSGFQLLNSYHVESVTRLSTGIYRLNLEYAMTNGSYYAVVGMGSATNMNIRTFPVGGGYIDVKTEDANVLSNTNTYMSVVVYGV